MERVRRIKEIESQEVRFFHGTTAPLFQNAFDREMNVLDMTIYPSIDNRFYFFKRFPPIDSFVVLCPTGKTHAAHYAITKAKKYKSIPLVISGVFGRSFKIKQSYGYGHYVETDSIPVDSVYLGKTRGFAWSLDGHFFLPPGSFRKMSIEEYFEILKNSVY